MQVSWGTKGSDKAEALPSVSSKKSKDSDQAVVDDTTRDQGDLDDQFKETVQRAVTKLVVKEVVEKPTLDDQNKTFRTRLVSVWMLSNAILAIAIQNINGLRNLTNPGSDEEALRSKQNFYFAVILYSTFGLSMIRFLGVSFWFWEIVSTAKELVLLSSACSISSSGTCFDGAGGTDRCCKDHERNRNRRMGESGRRRCPFSPILSLISRFHDAPLPHDHRMTTVYAIPFFTLIFCLFCADVVGNSPFTRLY